MNKTVAKRTICGILAILMLMLLCGGVTLSMAEGITTPTDMEEPVTPEPAPEEPVVYMVSVFVQQSQNASDFVWVGKLPLTSASGTPALSVEQLTGLLSDKGLALDLSAYAFQYGTGSEMNLSNWLGSEMRGENPVIVFHRAPAETALFVLLSPLGDDDEEEILIDSGELDVIGPAPGSTEGNAINRRSEVDVVNLPYTVTIEVVDPREVYYYGDPFTLRAVVTGTIQQPTYQWEVLPLDAEEWQLVEGATEETYTFILDEVNSKYDIRVTVYDAAMTGKGE